MSFSKDPSIGTPYQDYLRRDGGSRPSILDSSPPDGSDFSFDSISAERYTSRAFHEREKAKLWPRVWQMACREEAIPEVGDYTIYDIADLSFLLVRQTDGRIKAFYNSCLHRGRMLATQPGSVTQFRCPFHGFTWSIDGALKEIPCRWDFPAVKDEDCALPQARVESWGGYGPNLNYRFRPNGDDHDSSIMEVMMLMRHPKGSPKPAAAPVHWLAADEPWTHATELGALGPIFDQDMSNLAFMQKGLRSSATKRLLLSRYQESRLRHLHSLLDRYFKD